MSQDNPSIVQVRLNIEFFRDIHTLLALYYLLPLLEYINALMKFSQRKDVFISNFMVVTKICQVDLFMMYINPMTKYQNEHLQLFCDVVENTLAISPKIYSTLDKKILIFKWSVTIIKVTFLIQLLWLAN